jgi:hypothetical protein
MKLISNLISSSDCSTNGSKYARRNSIAKVLKGHLGFIQEILVGADLTCKPISEWRREEKKKRYIDAAIKPTYEEYKAAFEEKRPEPYRVFKPNPELVTIFKNLSVEHKKYFVKLGLNVGTVPKRNTFWIIKPRRTLRLQLKKLQRKKDQLHA